MNRMAFVLAWFALVPVLAHSHAVGAHDTSATYFSSNFSDQNFCEFDLRRMPAPHGGQVVCGPDQFLRYAKIENLQGSSFVQVTMDNSVLFNEKYKYKMELSVPSQYRYREGQTTEHTFSLLVPTLPQREKIFEHLSTTATAYVIAQWHAVNDNSPPMALRILNSKELLVTIDIDDPLTSGTQRLTLWRGAVTVGEVMVFNVVAHWDRELGSLEIVKDGAPIVAYNGPLGQRSEQDEYYFKYGLYNSYKTSLPDDFRFVLLLGDLRQTVRE